MKKISFVFTLFLLQFNYAQNINLKVNIAKDYKIRNFEIVTDSFHFVISDSGIMENFYSSETEIDYEYYDNKITDNANYGKIRKIGNSEIKYWDDNFTNKDKFGKLKTAGNIKIDYWDNNFFDKDKYQKIKNIGDIKIDYYDNRLTDKSDYGKIKQIGNFKINYFDNSIFDKSKYGKIKSIGNTSFDYFENIIDNDINGKLKSVKGKTPHLFLEFE